MPGMVCQIDSRALRAGRSASVPGFFAFYREFFMTAFIQIKLSESDMAAIKAAAAENRITPSALIRLCVFQNPLMRQHVHPPVNRELIAAR
jgi:hypothetical protein